MRPRPAPRLDVAALWAAPVLAAAAAVVLALISHAHHFHALGGLARGTVAGVALFLVCGDAAARVCAPVAWRRLHWPLAAALGAPLSGLVLLGFGVAHVPLHVSLWLALALFLALSVWVRRRRFARQAGPVGPVGAVDAAGSVGPVGEARGRAVGSDRGLLWAWLAVLAVVFCVMIIPAGRLGYDTVYGQNPDAVQVVGIANLFQHIPPTASDDALPLNQVPPAWRFRYPIFYPLAAASSLVHDDPIRVFPAMAALLGVLIAFACGLFGVELLGLPARAGPAISTVVGFSWVLEYLVWHPYWNQLWGLLMLVLSLLFGLRALAQRDGRLGVLCVVSVLMLWFSYPLALPYAIVILAALVVAFWRRPRLVRPRNARSWLLVLLGLGLLIPAIAGSALKLGQGVSQLLSPHSALWGGDIFAFLPFGRFVGVGGGLVVGLVVLAVAGWALLAPRILWGGSAVASETADPERGLPPRGRLLLAAALGALVLLDLRFRLAPSGTYMDFKHLSFVGTLILVLAAGGMVRLVVSRSWVRTAVAGVLVLTWLVSALVLDRSDAILQGEQVTAQLFQLRQWGNELPRHASISIAIPEIAGGVQLWATYMLGEHPLNAPDPVSNSTYAHAIKGARADYSVTLRYQPNADPNIKVPFPTTFGSVNPPLKENDEFILRRIVWPQKYSYYPDDSSTRLVEP